MTNPYFNRPASVAAGTTIRSDKYNSDLDTHESAFNALHDKLQHAVFLPETFSGNPNIPEQTVNDTFIYIDTSGNISLYPIATILEQFELVEQRYNQINAWQAQVAEDAIEAQDSATLSQRFANEAEDIEVISGLYSAKHWAKHAEAQIPLLEAAAQAKVDEAQTKVVLAQSYANAEKNVEVEAGFYSAKHYALVAADQIPLVESAGQAKVTLAQSYANAAKNVEVEAGFYSAKHYSLVAGDQLAIVQAAGQEKVDDAAAQVTLAANQANNAATQANNAASSATQSDNFANYAHNQLVPNSGGKYSAYHWSKEAEAYAQQTLSAVNGDFVPNTRTVNGKALDQNIIIGTADIQGLATVATSGSYADLSNKPTAADVGALAVTGKAADSQLLDGFDSAQFLRKDATQTNIANLEFSVIYLENQKHSISNNDGTGNFNIKVGTAHGSSNCTEIGYGSHFVFDQGSGLWSFKVSSQSQAVGEAYTWVTPLAFDYNSVDLYVPLTIQGATPYTTSNLPNPVQTGDLATVATSGSYNDLSNKPTTTSLGAVPTTRTVNGKALSSNITLNASDVSALPSSTTLSTLGGVPTSRQVNGKALTGNITLNASDVNALPNTTTLSTLGGVPTSRTVNGKALSSNITLNASDVSALPNTTTISTLGGVPTSRQVNGKALTGNITLNHNDVGALSSTEKATKIQRVTGSFTATRLAGITEYVTTSTGNTTCTINDNAFAADEKLVIRKQRQSGQLNIVSGNLIYLQDGTSAASHHIPAGYACTVELVFTGSSSELRIYN